MMAEDLLLLRNGDEFRGKLDVVSDKEISFTVKSGSLFSNSSERRSVPTSDVYMVKTDKRGTIFFDRQRERKMVETTKPDKSADLIYLVDGGEVQAWQISIANNVLSYQKDKKQLRAMSNVGAFPIEDVFMVKYSDGSKDIFTDISGGKTEKPNDLVTEQEEIKLKVVMYNVQRGETLGQIAGKFGVSVSDIVEWNDLSSKSTEQTKPVVGGQLMIQTRIK